MNISWIWNLLHKKTTPTTPPPVSPPTEIIQSLLAIHNQDRKSRGLSPLSLSPQLVSAAQAHANFMASHNNMNHQGIGDGTPWDRMQRQGYHYSRAGENIAMGQRTAAEVMFTWEHSPGHMTNILGIYRDMGAAVAYSSTGVPFWCVDFGTPLGMGVGTDSGELTEFETHGETASSLILTPDLNMNKT